LFLNAAISVDWGGQPRALLEFLLGVERDLGRTRGVKWGPRTIDLDVLWIEGGQRVEEAGLVVPHPRLGERAFAVRPLLDVAPEAPFIVPGDQDVTATELSLDLTEP
jgi:2-amino-4-hydroxy-6-hydroxymethyldihydropteridine diphosphokinase